MPAMKHYSCWIILYLLIFAGLILPLDADGTFAGEDSDCMVEIRVRRHTVYNATLGQELKINCTVIFCNDSPPTITWGKRVPANFSSDSHIKTEWKHVSKSAGISYLIFTRILQSDAGQYQCRGGDSVSHFINVSVHDPPELTTATWTTVAAESELPAFTFWPFVYRVLGTLVFIVIVILICITSKRGCKGKPRKARKPSETHVYDNDV